MLNKFDIISSATASSTLFQLGVPKDKNFFIITSEIKSMIHGSMVLFMDN